MRRRRAQPVEMAGLLGFVRLRRAIRAGAWASCPLRPTSANPGPGDPPLTFAQPSPVMIGRMVWWESAAAPSRPWDHIPKPPSRQPASRVAESPDGPKNSNRSRAGEPAQDQRGSGDSARWSLDEPLPIIGSSPRPDFSGGVERDGANAASSREVFCEPNCLSCYTKEFHD